MKIVYPSHGTVSVWVGTFESETAFDHCVDSAVVPLLKLGVPITSICEVDFAETKKTIKSLLDGFSGYESFGESAYKRALEMGVSAANSALVCYYLQCEDAPSKWGSLTFLGSFKGQDMRP